MKRLLTLLLGLAAAIGAMPSASLAYTSTGTSYPLIVVDNGPGRQSDPHVSGQYAVYTDADTTIKYFDFNSQTTGAVPTAAGAYDSLSDISGSTVVFTRVEPDGSTHIYSYPIGGPVSEVAPSATGGRKNPSIGASTIAWEDVGISANGNPEMVVDSGGTPTQLTNDPAADLNPNVSADGSTVVWQKCEASCDVYEAVGSGASWAVRPVAATTANETSPDTNGNLIVYASDGGGTHQIHFQAVAGGSDHTIALPAGCSEGDHPAIAGDFIAFEAFCGAQTDIWAYDVADGSLRQITSTPENEHLSDVSVTTGAGVSTVTVVWQVLESDLNVYATQFQVSSQPPFTDQFLQPLAQSTDPANPVINTGKNGKVIPVKVQISQGGTAITDANTPGPVTIAVSKLASCSSTAGTDPVTTYADAGQSSAGTNQFHYDTSTQAWAYNLDTKALGLITGNCYRIDVAVNGTQLTNAFAVFQPTK